MCGRQAVGRRGTAARRLGDGADGGGASAGTPGGCQEEREGASEGGRRRRRRWADFRHACTPSRVL